MRRVKVLVVGGGPAGAAAAVTLARNRTDVLLLERDFSFAKPCGGAIPAPGYRELGLSEDLVQRRVDEFRLVAPSGRHVDIPLQEPVFIVERGRFDRYLRDEAAKAGAAVTEGEFVSLERSGTRCRALIRERDSEYVCEADYLIAADGVNSRVRAMAGKNAAGADTLFAAREIVSGYDQERCEFRFSQSVSPGMYAWIFPAGAGAAIGTGGRDPRAVRAQLDRFKEQAGLAGRPDSLSMYRIPVWNGDLYQRDTVLFCGDAAGQVMPLSYEGIYYAMKSASCAAEAVIEGKPGSYRGRWKKEFGRIFVLASLLSGHFLKNDVNAERLVALHNRQDVQEIAQDLWLMKRHRGRHMSYYLKLIGAAVRRT